MSASRSTDPEIKLSLGIIWSTSFIPSPDIHIILINILLVMTSMSFSPKSGCPMCGIVSSGTSSIGADTSTDPNPATDIQQQEILWRDDNITVYKEKVHPVSSKGHIIIVFKYVCDVAVCFATH